MTDIIESLKVPKLLIAVHCPTKSRAVGTIVRSASALGAKMLVLVGDDRIGMHGAFGSNQRIQILHFETWNQAREFLDSKRNHVYYYGISPPGCSEATELQSLDDVIFPLLTEDDSACFVVGGRDEPLSDEIVSFLDVPIKVNFPNPHFALKLKFEEVLAIVIHHYVSSVKDNSGAKVFKPCSWKGEKFIKEDVVVGGHKRRGISLTRLAQRRGRKEHEIAQSANALEGLSGFMGDVGGGDY